ncbi:hypothetical protein [Litchfieldia alkalitelluris]|uniref:hypothetical protein n=1 Tax=Litchfieldia alkalitelluris TaxID=304268 RepID=UPI0009961F39|nr:hypothetical protein [Litchfieldia alkalitelluris]
MKQGIFIVLSFFIVAGCTNDKPVPEASYPVEVDFKEDNVSEQNIQQVSTMKVNPERNRLMIQKEVVGKNVYVECFISNFSFRKNNLNEDFGFIELFVDGKKVDEIMTAAFIIKGLTKGTHLIRVDLNKVSADRTLSEEFEVTIR